MELQVLETQGFSADHILSVRAGTTRRQVSVSHGQPLYFPTLPENASSVKIDVMKPMGSCNAQVKPKDAEYTVNIAPTSKEDTDMMIKFAVKEAPQHASTGPVAAPAAPSPKAKGRLEAALGAREYLDEHNLFMKVQEMLAYVINEKPEDPYDYMIDFLAKQKKAKGDDAKQKAKESAMSIDLKGIETGMKKPVVVPKKVPCDPEGIKAKLGFGIIRAAKTGELTEALAQARSPAKAASEDQVKAKLALGLTQALKSGDLSQAFRQAKR